MVVLNPNPQARKPPTARPVPIPPPIGGWNTRDSLDGMAPTDAVALDNWFPGLGSVDVRGGSTTHATGLGGTVKTLAEYYAGGTRKLLAAANGSIFDVSSTGAAGAALKTGFTSDAWQTANFKAVQFWVNGQDVPQTFDGTSFADTGWTGPTSVNNLVGVYVFKNFVFLWENGSQDFWYGSVNAITGALTSFPLSMVASRGGNLLAISTLGFSGNSPDDLAAFIMSSGEVILYQGTDPGNASAWALVGRYYIGTPVNIRAVTRYGGDTYITTLQDHTSLNSWFGAIRNGVPPQPSKVSGAVLAASSTNASSFGWDAIVYPAGGKMVFNIPNADGSFEQHVVNTVTGAWCRYLGWNAYCWSLFQDNLYFGTTGGVVVQAETGTSDVGVVAIPASGQQAWNQLQSPFRKRVAAFRPIIQSAGAITYAAGLGYDYGAPTVGTATSTPSAGSAWDVSPWDVSPWGADIFVDTNWRAGGGTGQSVSVAVNVLALQQISWLRTDLRIETGINL